MKIRPRPGFRAGADFCCSSAAGRFNGGRRMLVALTNAEESRRRPAHSPAALSPGPSPASGRGENSRFGWLRRMPREPPPPGPLPPLRRGGGDLNRASAGPARDTGSLPPRQFAGEGLGMGGRRPRAGPAASRQTRSVPPRPRCLWERVARVSARPGEGPTAAEATHTNYADSCFSYPASSRSDDRPATPSCAYVHCSGALSGRQRTNLVPWRKRPPLMWS